MIRRLIQRMLDRREPRNRFGEQPVPSKDDIFGNTPLEMMVAGILLCMIFLVIATILYYASLAFGWM